MSEVGINENQAIIEAVKDLSRDPHVVEVGDRRIVARPVKDGYVFHSEKDLFCDVDPKPLWREGFESISSLDSLIDYINRFKDGDSVAFINRNNGKIRATLDYHKAGEDMVTTARHGNFGAIYEPRKSRQWQVWTQVADHSISHGRPQTNWLGQEEFSDLIHTNIFDLDPVITLNTDVDGDGNPLAPGDHAINRALGLHSGRVATPEQMMTMARGLRFTQSFEASEHYDRNTGTRRVTFTENPEDTPEEVALTNFFLLAIPVFESGELFRLGAHLTYRLTQKRVQWRVELLRKREVLEAAISGLESKLRKMTGIPVFSEG